MSIETPMSTATRVSGYRHASAEKWYWLLARTRPFTRNVAMRPPSQWRNETTKSASAADPDHPLPWSQLSHVHRPRRGPGRRSARRSRPRDLASRKPGAEWGGPALGYVRAVQRLGVLASGSGTVLQAILDAGLPVGVVVVDRPCAATERAADAGAPVEVVERTSFGPDFDRVAYTHRVVDALKRHEVDLVAMAGFGTILAEPVHEAFPGRIVNTHPALLPAFKGWHAVEDALAAGVKVTGWTAHLANLDVDDGPILAQEAVAVRADDTVDTLHERIKQVERRRYPEVLRDLLDGLAP